MSSVVPVVDRPLGEGCEKYFGVRPTFFTAANQRSIVVQHRPPDRGRQRSRRRRDRRGRVRRRAGDRDQLRHRDDVRRDRRATARTLGVAIATGLQVSLDALVGRTAKLPQVALVAPGTPIGRDTVSAIQAGLVYGAVGQTEELVRRIARVIGANARVIASGGLAPVVAAETAVIERVEPHLVLHGLRIEHLRAKA